ncbi:MAG: thymidine phosphorylase [Mycoplasmataceae bacterium]|nr:thymidine phosphorylase [Mycoplasmataceae bacterium]
MNIIEIIEKKKNKKKLNFKEIDFFVQNYSQNKIPDYQISSLLMAIVINGMDLDEATNLTKSMIASGKTIDLSSIKGVKVDKHSTGGVGDKVSLVLGPIIAACGGIFAKMSGRGLGHTGGTIDKLESIDGFSCFLSDEKFIELVKKTNISIIGQTDDLVPADKKIYALRDTSGTVNSIPLIAASIMSKKIATGADVILLDIKCGSGAFMKNQKEAEKLANWMIQIGKKMKKKIKVEITNMEQPLGKMIGNKNEVIEAINTLQNKGEKNFVDLIYSSSSILLIESKIAKNEKEAYKMIDNVLKNELAFKKFIEMVKNQGGDVDKIQSKNWWNPKYSLDVIANKSGYLYLKNSMILGLVAMELGAGRKTKEDKIDNEAGIELKKVTNEKVEEGEVIMKLYSSKKINPNLIDKLNQTFEINPNPKKIKTVLKKIS